MPTSVSSGLGMPGSSGLAGQDPQSYHLKIRFTGSGSEYFRIWLVNLLLILVTLGIYYPWAKVRRLRYFHGNTLIDGAPLDFHGKPTKMLKGYLLVGLLFSLYSAAGKFSATAGLIAFLIVMALWPALLKSSMQFRLANTSWRGMRFRFQGSLPEVYRAVLPMFIPGLAILAALVGVADPDKPPSWYVLTAGAVLLGTVAVMPWLLWNLKQFQHNNYALASLTTKFKATPGSFYMVFLKTGGVMVLAVVLASLLAGALAAGLVMVGASGGLRGGRIAGVLGALLGALAGLLALLIVVRPYLTARLQNLIWTRTGNASLRFLSDLRFKRLLGLTLKNWLLVILTLGFYWPFAAVAVARMRLEAVTVKTRVSPDTLVNQMKGPEGDAAGEAAGDLFGLDIGL
ncbi:MAG: DUF898 domain-containing protein [Haliea sp.]|nr:MAG: DUF898 domain-containing protein [Haliea sp.]